MSISRRDLFVAGLGLTAALAMPATDALAKGRVYPKHRRVVFLQRQVIEAHEWLKQGGHSPQFEAYLRDRIIPDKLDRLLDYLLGKFAPVSPVSREQRLDGNWFKYAGINTLDQSALKRIPDAAVPYVIILALKNKYGVTTKYHADYWPRYQATYPNVV